jgi:hypothetical protein
MSLRGYPDEERWGRAGKREQLGAKPPDLSIRPPREVVGVRHRSSLYVVMSSIDADISDRAFV